MNKRKERADKKTYIFSVRIPGDISEWFAGYLERYSAGKDTSERFRQFLYRLQARAVKGCKYAA